MRCLAYTREGTLLGKLRLSSLAILANFKMRRVYGLGLRTVDGFAHLTWTPSVKGTMRLNPSL